MTDEEKIKQEIEKRLSLLWDLIPKGERVLQDNFTKDDANNLGKYTALESLLKFIDSLPEEPASEDLEEAADQYALRDSQAYKSVHCTYVDDKIAFKAGAEWQKEKHNKQFGFLDLKDCKDAYNEWKSSQDNPSAALAWVRACEWQKHQMKETLQTEYEKGRFDMREEMMKDVVDGEYWDGSIYLDNRPTEYKDGDKVKIIIVKEEQQ
jgi:hypothetical protein